jgi:hypothetical protein
VYLHAGKLSALGDVFPYKCVNKVSGVLFHFFLRSAADPAALD